MRWRVPPRSFAHAGKKVSFYLVDVELALASGHFSVARGELSDEVMTARSVDLDGNTHTTGREILIKHQQHYL